MTKKRKLSANDARLACEYIGEGFTTVETARRFKVAPTTLWRALVSVGCPAVKYRDTPRIDADTVYYIIDARASGMKGAAVAAKYGLTLKQVYKVWEKAATEKKEALREMES